ncbi:hypothetical protein FTUN_2101 [Frigoriglobus tundricola]|uniref:Uncharacterized protein n=1 Tax=Frigoriglobus tundricola TaxID=2774151 RepID=A0A6M5YML3_9BACT|nr:hypothetical protein FTUN_2101 [Frigoriglobus tundricola]
MTVRQNAGQKIRRVTALSLCPPTMQEITAKKRRGIRRSWGSGQGARGFNP